MLLDWNSMTGIFSSVIFRKFTWAGLATAAVLSVGTAGYWFIGNQRYSFVDCLYMTVITVLTIGYGEIIDMSHSPAGRIFTMFIAFAGIGTLTYILSNITAFVVEGDLTQAFRRKKMEKAVKKMKDHYIVCGIEGVGFYIVNELSETKRAYVIVDIDNKEIEKLLESFPKTIFVSGDATDSDVLLNAGIKEAKGLFAVTGDDNQNLVISLTAKELNPRLRVVARCKEIKNIEKLKKAGADSIVKTAFISGLRMASEMIRPTVVTFLDTMLRDKGKNLRIEEVPVSHLYVGKSLSELNLKKYSVVLLLAVKTKDDYIYNPSDDYIIVPDTTLIIMTTPEGRQELQGIFSHD